MLYDVSLDIDYEYETPVTGGRHLVRVLPVSRADVQQMSAGKLIIAPAPAERSDDKDFFGNATSAVVFRDTHDALNIKMRARIEVFRKSHLFDFAPRLADLPSQVERVWSVDENAPHHFLSASPRVPLSAEISDYAVDMMRPSMTAREAVQTICDAVYNDFSFDAAATTVDTTPQEAFEQKAGVCQDLAHVTISALRGVGIPAGYVSGYLRTIPPEGQEPLEGADAMHAWVRAWCGVGMGWIELDPTNGIIVEQDHIVVAYGRDYGDVAPVLGMVRMAGGQDTKQAVTVAPVE